MTGQTILIADDDRGIRTVLSQSLARAGFEVRATSNAATLWRWVANLEGDLVITDVIMPDENGLDMLPRIRKLRPELPVIVMSAQKTLMTALKAAERGAYEYLPKPFDLNELTRIVRQALSPRKSPRNRFPKTPGDGDDMPLIGQSQAMQDVYRLLARVMPTNLTVMITGESGTGKELVARALHDFGKRRNGPFVAINMAAIPRELIESELFGHERGAFTGADSRRSGRFEQSQGGTVFLDEIGDMPPEAQTRLLRVLQDGEYTPVGARSPIKADVRIIAATHQDLKRLINQGLFREDLYYRLNVVPIRLPALRERTDDIPDLSRRFLDLAVKEGLPEKTLDDLALRRLKRHDWPGNVRELENLIRRIAALYAEDVIGEGVIEAELADTAPAGQSESPEPESENLGEAVERHLARYFAAHGDELPPRGLYARVIREVERPLLAIALAAARGNQLKAAELLGLNRNTLRKKIRELDIPIVRSLK